MGNIIRLLRRGRCGDRPRLLFDRGLRHGVQMCWQGQNSKMSARSNASNPQDNAGLLVSRWGIYTLETELEREGKFSPPHFYEEKSRISRSSMRLGDVGGHHERPSANSAHGNADE